jgi:dihydropteroate synthase
MHEEVDMARLTEQAYAAFAEEARRRGVGEEQLVFDPGIDLAKTPAQSVEVLRRLPELDVLGGPLLVAVSRKDFVGAITTRAPRARLGGTLAAIGHGVDAGAHVLRVHDVAETVDFLAVRAALTGGSNVDPALRLSEEIRREQGPP